MAKNDKSTESTELATPDSMSIAGTFMPADFEQFVNDDGGFAVVRTVLIGAPMDERGNKTGRTNIYLGELIGPGAELEVSQPGGKGEKSKLPTWAFHPYVKAQDGRIGVAKNITHVIPAPHVLNSNLERIAGQADRTKTTATVGIKFLGKITTRAGNPLNDFEVVEKFANGHTK